MAAFLAFVTRHTTLHHLFHSTKKPIFYSTITTKKPQNPFPLDFPTNSNHKNLIHHSILLKKYGYPSSQIPDFLTKNEFLLQFSTPKVEKSIKIVSSLNPSKDFLVSLVNDCPSVLEYEFMQKWEKFVDKVKGSCISSIAIKHVLEVCRRFDLGPDDVFRCVDCLKGLGLSGDSVGKVLEGFPSVIMMNQGVICRNVAFFEDIGIEREDLFRIIRLYPGVLAFGVENKLKPLFEEFEGLGFSLDMVNNELVRDPRVLELEPGELSHCLRMLRSLKCRVGIKEDIFREGAFRAGYELKLRVGCLRKYGLTHRDAFTVLWKEPRAIVYDIKDIENKVDFLIQTMKCDILCLVDAPEYLGVNFEKQILPRFNVIERLRSMGGIADEQMGLRSLIKPSRLRFYNLYVKPYPECEKIYGRYTEVGGNRSKHPVGMWKIFKPQKFEQSKEDIMLIRSYMEKLNCKRL
ncbi:hypothetical protein LIER_36351 [Lithospermum erythrorhizon]|uniref:Uncharacterized protein n=1 Tax=Lithospermum erythrorhizon TaxID=34254 RepID=A0AAV3P696_LITER